MISVVMPVRDGAAFVGEAIESILGQSERDLELIAIDDASSDDTPRILERIRDPRLRVVRNDERRGIAGSLNRGIAIARGAYIARMDADDVALPRRLETQRAFLDAHPHIALCGAHVRMFDGAWQRDRKLETHPERIRCALFLFNVLSHPTALWRRDAFERHGLAYDETFENSEDYDLWSRASHCVGIGNVPEVLLRYRVHPAQAGRDRAVRVREGARVRRAQLARLGVTLSDEQWTVHETVAWRQRVRDTKHWLETLVEANERTRIYDRPLFRAFLREQLCLAGAWRYLTPSTLVRVLTGAIDDRRRAAAAPPA